MMLWVNDKKNWSKTEADKQDKKWLYILARNSCEPDLRMKVDKEFNKLGEKYRVAACIFT